jgi:F-type H+-transporting ATPase subunit alpha
MNSFTEYLDKNKEVGYIQKLHHSNAEVVGLPNVTYGEMVVFESGQLGQVSALKENTIEVLVLTKDILKVGIKVARMKRRLMVPIGDNLLGHTIDPLGKTILGGILDSGKNEMRPVDVVPTGISTRKRINKPMYTGVAMVDMMIPLGKGQRELIIGDRKTGKSHLLLQAAVTQVKNGSICVYAGIAKKKSEIKRIEAFLKQNGVLNNSVIVATSSQDSAGEIFICPYTGMAVAEYFRDQGRDVLLILDDMTSHAIFYRELSLISGKFPGRDSYPGDIFHIHSKLLERGGNFNINGHEASITCLPIADTAQGDITGYIQTNLMSMTDGHIYFDAELFFKGRRPAINPFVSVTRVGHQAQTPLAREAGRILMDLLSSYERTQGFLRFGAELGESSRQILTMGERVLAFFDQPSNKSIPFSLQLVLLALLVSGIWDGKNVNKILQEYGTNTELVRLVDDMVATSFGMNKLIEKTRQLESKIMPFLT